MAKTKNKQLRKIEYCEVEPKECDGNCCYSKKKKRGK